MGDKLPNMGEINSIIGVILHNNKTLINEKWESPQYPTIFLIITFETEPLTFIVFKIDNPFLVFLIKINMELQFQ